MTVRIDMINQALIAIGDHPLQSETAPNGPRFVAIYKDAISALCSEYPWQHCTAFRQLAQLTASPVQNQWNYAYALPSDMEGTPRAVYDRIVQSWGSGWSGDPSIPPVTDFEIYGGLLYANYTALWCRFTQQPNEAIWPAWFRNLAKKLLMAEYAIPAREDLELREKMMLEVYGPPEHQGEGGLIAKCKAIDSQGKPSSTIQIGLNPLVAVRWS
jgi:hypothetical protein